MSTEALQAREDLMRSIENFLKKFNRISFRETPKVLMQAWDKLLEIKHAQSEDVQDLINKLVEDVQKINEDLADYIIPLHLRSCDQVYLAPSSDVMTKSSSTSLNLFLKETNTCDNSSPESENFCFNLEENSSGSTTTRSDYSFPDYEEKSSGSTTTHADFSQYDSFIFDLSINPFPPADRSDFYHEEFADELAHIISPSEYDHFCFKIEPELGNLTMDVVEDILPTREPRVHVPNVLPTHPTLNLDFILLSEPLFAYIVWIFLPFLTYPVAPPYLLSCGDEDIIFDPGISNYHSFMPDVSHRSGTFMKFNVYPNHLNESPMMILSSTCSPMDQ
ncbi:hypothetical protein Tco_0782884 [Tanacetum coccineum]